MKIILKDVNIVHPQQNQLKEKTSLLIVDGVITKIGNLDKEDSKDAKVFELNGKVVTPGFFDMHVHFREPGREDEETVQTGCNSAANGGFTGVACMPNTEPAIDSAQVIELIKKQADCKKR
ncbi:MAG: amidohydrolase family protein [Ignavibacteriaceae bacterium]